MYVPPTTPARPVPRSPRVLLAAHLIWEGVLLLLTVVAAGIVASEVPLFGSGGPWLQIGMLGLLAVAFALSLRTATPNLAVPALAALAGYAYAKFVQEGWSVVVALVVAVLMATAIGAVMGAIAGLTAAPAWAVSLGGLGVAQAIGLAFADGGQSITLREGAMGNIGMGLWTGLFVVVSIGGGVLWQVPAVRNWLGANRSAAGPTVWRPARLVGALIGLTGSSLLAGLGGVVIVAYVHFATPFDSGRLLPMVAAVLLGGVSVYGRHGGIAGTVLGVALISMVTLALTVYEAPVYVSTGIAGLAILAGVLVSRAFEQIAGPEPVEL